MSYESLRTSGLAVTTASAACSALIWTAVSVGALPPSPIALPFAILAGVAILAGLHSWLAVYVTFLVRFLPVGLYLLGGPSWFALVGILDLTYLAGGILMHVAWITSLSRFAVSRPRTT